MKFRILSLLMFATLFLTIPAIAPADNSGGSTYSVYGIGDLRYFMTDRGMAMGGAGIAVLSPLSVDRMNPAAWGEVLRTRFSVSALYEGFSSDDGARSTYLSKTNFNGLILALPISPEHGITVSTGITPYSKVNYNIITQQSQSGVDYTLHYLGEGGLSVAHLGTSFKISSELYIGGTLNYYFGSIVHSISQAFTDVNLSNSQVIRTMGLHGIGWGFGATYAGLKNIFRLPESQSLNIAAVVSSTSWLTFTEERVQMYSTGLVSPPDTVNFPDLKFRLPFTLTAGISWSTDKMLLAGDFKYQPWSEASLGGSATPGVRDNYRFGAGVEILPSHEPGAAFGRRVAWRFGAYYDATYYQIAGEPINEWGITGGAGLPVWLETRFNIAMQYGWRGTTDHQLQKDRILRLSLSMSIGESWFVRPQEE